MSPLFVDPFGRFVRFCNQEFDEEANSDGRRSANIGEGFLIFRVKFVICPYFLFKS